MNLPADHLARQAALDPSRSFAVTAPAGSGKTGLLTQRVLTLLAQANEPEEILSITFTRKAAAEMQERISQALITAATTERPEIPHEQLSWDLAHKVLQRDQRQNWQLLKSPGRLRVQTIDGLCRAITQFQPLSSGLGGSTQMLDDPIPVYQQAVRQTMKQLDADGNLTTELSLLLEHLDNNLESSEELLVSLLARRDQWMEALLQSRDARGYLESVLVDLKQEALDEIVALLLPYASDLCLSADFAADNCKNDKPDSPICHLAGISELPGAGDDDHATWLALTDLLLTADGQWRKSTGINKNIGFPTSKDKEEKARLAERKQQFIETLGQLKEQPKLLSLLQMLRYLPASSYPEKQWRLLDALTRVLPRLVGELHWAFRQLNATDFIEVTQGALKALGDSDSPTDTTLMLDYQIQHILVDEFQDTSTPQLHMLEQLTSGWEPGDGRTLFIVGDGMQSCYGFRAANVGIFLDARRNGIGTVPLEPLDLTVNFRSQQKVVEWVNEAFDSAFPDSDDIARGAVRYSHSIAFKEPLEGKATQLHGFINAAGRTAEAGELSQLIKSTQQQYPEDSIAVLVRNRGHLRDIIPAFQEHSIDWLATDIEPLSGRMVIVDLLTLTQAILDPADRNAWLALLRTPWIGLDNADLLTIAGLKPRNDVDTDTTEQNQAFEFKLLLSELMNAINTPETSALSPRGIEALRRTIPLIQQCWANRRRKPLRQQIQGLWLTLGGAAAAKDDSDLINADDFFALLDRFEEGGTIERRDEFQRAVERLYARPSTLSGNPVQVMTIHKSKGLEFDHVFIPGLDKGQKADDQQLILWQERINSAHEKQLILSPLAPKGADQDRLYQFLQQEEKLKQRLEATRLLYVGCTRAIKSLHLLANLKTDSKDNLRAPSAGSLLNPLWSSVSDQFSRHACSDSEDIPQEDDNTQVHYQLQRLSGQWQRPNLEPEPMLQFYRGQEFDDDDNLPDESLFRNRAQRHTGTVMHRALAQVVKEGVLAWGDQRIEQQQPFWEVQLRGHGIIGQELTHSLKLIQRAVKQSVSDPHGVWLLDDGHQDSHSEREIWSGGTLPKLSIVDRTFIDQGVRWIIDYKSSEPTRNQPLDDFLQEEVCNYRDQLQRYYLLYQQELTDQRVSEIRTALYFPLIQHLELVDFSEKS